MNQQTTAIKRPCRLLFMVLLALCSRVWAAPAEANTDTRCLLGAAAELAHGQPDAARGLIDHLQSQPTPAVERLRQLTDRYTQLMADLRQAQEQSFRDYGVEMIKTMDAARWRLAILQASKAFSLASDEKSQFEQDQAAKIDENWLKALAKMAQAYNLAERAVLKETLDPETRREITAQALRIAGELESQGKGLEAYSKVYGYLSALDKDDPWEEHSRGILRKLGLKALYVPDPNQEGVSWQDRRRDITREVFDYAINLLSVNYIDDPNYKEMTRQGIGNCLLLTQAAGLDQAFPQLKDALAVGDYQEQLEKLMQKCRQVGNKGTYLLPLEYLREVLAVNEKTLNFPEGVLIAEYAEGVFGVLDGYTYVVWPGDTENFDKDMTHEFTGVGIQISKQEGQLTVDSLLEDTPASKAGLDAGDIIIAVDGKSTTNITLEMAVKRITGPKGTNVTLTIDRKGFDKPRDFTITRDKIVEQTVKGLYREPTGNWQYFADPNDGVAYVRLTGFAAETPGRLRSVLTELKQMGMKSLIMDLRNNSGGYLSGAVEISNLFLKQGLIVSTRPRDPSQAQYEYAVEKNLFDADLPLVVLVNGASASASEIVSGALKDQRRATIVGTRSFGKGNVQTIQKFRYNNAEMKMTIAYYYLPSGRRVHHDPKDRHNEDYGVFPDIKLELTAKQLDEYFKARQDAGILHKSDTDDAGNKWTVFTAAGMVEKDPQLQAGILSLQAQTLARSLGQNAPAESCLAGSPVK